MTPRGRNFAEIDAIAEMYDYTLGDILGKGKNRTLVKVRRKCVVMLRDKGYSTTEIGRIMQRDHSTICHALSMYVLKGEGDDTIEA